MYGTISNNEGAQERTAGRSPAPPLILGRRQGLPPKLPVSALGAARPAGAGRYEAEVAGSGRRYKVLDVGRWSFDRINRELNELASQGWKLIAVAGYGQCGVRLWLVK